MTGHFPTLSCTVLPLHYFFSPWPTQLQGWIDHTVLGLLQDDNALPCHSSTNVELVKKSKSQQFRSAEVPDQATIDVELVKNPSLNSFAVHKW